MTITVEEYFGGAEYITTGADIDPLDYRGRLLNINATAGSLEMVLPALTSSATAWKTGGIVLGIFNDSGNTFNIVDVATPGTQKINFALTVGQLAFFSIINVPRNLNEIPERIVPTDSYYSFFGTGTADQNAAFGPDGTYTMERINDNDPANGYKVWHDFAVAAKTKYTFSAYMRGKDSPSAGIALGHLQTPFETSDLRFNPLTGVFEFFTDTGLAGGQYQIERIPGAEESGASSSSILGLWRVQVTLSTTTGGSYRAELIPSQPQFDQDSTFFGSLQFEEAPVATEFQFRDTISRPPAVLDKREWMYVTYPHRTS